MEPRLRGSLDSTSSTLEDPLRRGITAAAGLQGFSQPVSGAIVTRQFRILCSYLCSGYNRSRFSRVVGLVSFVFHYWGEKDAVCVAFLFVFLITADREMVPISSGASPFHQIGWAEHYCKKAFVQLRLLMIWYSITVSTKTNDPTAVSANPTKSHGKKPT